MTLRYHAGAEVPSARLWLTDDMGDLVDLTALDLTALIVRHGRTVETKTSGLVGAAGDGTEPSGDPNLTITWDAGELAVPAGNYDLRIEARTGSSLDYVWVTDLVIPTSIPT